MKKKGTQELMFFIHLLLAVIILLTLLFSTNKIKEGDIYQQKAHSKNIAFLYDSIMSSPSKSTADYKIRDKELNIIIDENCIVKINKEGQIPEIYYCALNTFLDTNCETNTNCLIEKNRVGINNG